MAVLDRRAGEHQAVHEVVDLQQEDGGQKVQRDVEGGPALADDGHRREGEGRRQQHEEPQVLERVEREHQRGVPELAEEARRRELQA